MQKKLPLGLLFVSFILALPISIQAQNTESMTITTYYPSPFGVYQTLRLFPNDNFTPGAACADRGQMYFDDSENRLYVCSGSPSSTWQLLGGFWMQVGTSLYPTDATWNVGIGTTAPTWRLDVVGNSRVNGWFRIGDSASTNNIQFETQAGFHRVAFNQLRFWDWDAGGDMVTLNDGTMSVSRFVIQKRAGNPPGPQEGEIWILN